jgi:hypothetical protein
LKSRGYFNEAIGVYRTEVVLFCLSAITPACPKEASSEWINVKVQISSSDSAYVLSLAEGNQLIHNLLPRCLLLPHPFYVLLLLDYKDQVTSGNFDFQKLIFSSN